MRDELVKRVREEEKRAIEKYGAIDDTPDKLLNAATEELGEVAHAVNHSEGVDEVQQEIVETIGVLSRLYEMVEIYTKV